MAAQPDWYAVHSPPRLALMLTPRLGLITDCDDDVMDEVSDLPRTPVWVTELDGIAKMEFLLMAPFARICQDASGTGERTG